MSAKHLDAKNQIRCHQGGLLMADQQYFVEQPAGQAGDGRVVERITGRGQDSGPQCRPAGPGRLDARQVDGCEWQFVELTQRLSRLVAGLLCDDRRQETVGN